MANKTDISDLLIIPDGIENPKAKWSLHKYVSLLYEKAKNMDTKGFSHDDMMAMGMLVSNIKEQHPKAYPHYDLKVRQLMCKWLDCAQYSTRRVGWGN